MLEERALYYPIWLSYATGLLEQNRRRVRLVDCPAWNWDINDVSKDLKKFIQIWLLSELALPV